MKNKYSIHRFSIVFLGLTLALILVSWIGSIYGVGEVQSLLSADGIRWLLGHVVENYVQAPALGVMLILFMGLGVVVRSGLYDVLKRLGQKEKQLSRKERRALTLAVAIGGFYGLLVILSLFLPWNFLLGITGSWLHSPFSKGLVYILSVGVGLSGMVYGYMSDAFHRLSDVFEGMSFLIARSASYWVALFFVVQFFSSLEYTRLMEWVKVDGGILDILYPLFCYIPLLFMRK